MQRRTAAAIVFLLVAVLGIGCWVGSTTWLESATAAPDAPRAAEPTVIMQPGHTSLLLTLGLNDKEPTDWSGQVEVSAGRVIAIEDLRLHRLFEGPAWQGRTERAAGPGPQAKGAARLQRVVLRLTLDVSDRTTAEVTTPQGKFSFAASELALDETQSYLAGAAQVQRVLPTRQLTYSPDDDDFPACAVAADGAVWCASTAYRRGTAIDQADVLRGNFESLVTRGHGDRVQLRSFAKGRWSPPIDLSGDGLDVWRPAVVVDRQGTVWSVWSQRVDNDWDLYGCSYDPATQKVGATRRLTSAPGPDFHVVATGGANLAQPWLAWQGTRDGNLEILAAPLTASGELVERRVSTSAANDWTPAIAADSTGRVWIAWDTYDRGNYDVMLRSLVGGRLDEPMPVANSPRFEARPQLLVDRDDRLWVAFEEGAEQWGMDYGEKYQGTMGTPLYVWRNVVVRCLRSGAWEQPVDELVADKTETHFDDTHKEKQLHQRISLPRLGLDGRGRVWLGYRRHPTLVGNGERWISLVTCYNGNQWTAAQVLQQSDNLLDNRPALVPLAAAQGMLAVYSTDHRTAGSTSAGQADLVAALVDAPAGKSAEFVPYRPAPAAAPEAAIHPNEAADVARMRNYRVRIAGKEYRLLRGEFHRHTEMSAHRDWDGLFEDMWRYALDVSSMDWLGPGDHDYAMGLEYMWWLTQKQIDLYYLAPRFMSMFTYERSVEYPSGHRNVMFARRGIRPLPRMTGANLMGTDEQGSPDIKNLYAYLRQFGGICSSHTSATNMGTDWRDHDPEVEPVVEIFQGHRQSYEALGAPMVARDLDDSIQGFKPAGMVWEAFKRGRKLGFQSSSDHVSTHLSYGVVLAEETSRTAIIDGFKRRHCYAAQDNIVMDIRSGDALMGDELTTATPPKLEIVVLGTAPIARLDIIRQIDSTDPQYVHQVTPNDREVRMTWTDTAAVAGSTNMYYVRVQQADTKLAWASPLWFHYRPAK